MDMTKTLAEVAADKAGLNVKETETVMVNVERELIPNERLAKILVNRAMLLRWFDALEQLAIERIQNGAVLPGLRLVEGRTHRKWRYGEEKIASKLTALGIDPYLQTLKKITDVEKELSGEKDLIESLTLRPKGKLKVVPCETLPDFELIGE
jgi:hypothetical protein